MNTSIPSPTIQNAIDEYIDVRVSRHANTGRTYRNALRKFAFCLQKNGVNPIISPISDLNEDAITWLIEEMHALSLNTERLYIDATVDFYKYVDLEGLKTVNIERVRRFVKMRARRRGRKLPQFPKEDIDRMLEKIDDLVDIQGDDNERLRALRDRALILSLADTGLRIHEACALDRGTVDFNAHRALITGKGKKDAIVRFSKRSIYAIDTYLYARTQIMDGKSGKPLSSLPLFARHDKGAGRKVKRMSTRTGQNILDERVAQLLGSDKVGTITPHSLRHWFVTEVLHRTENLKLAQRLARHENIGVTQLYAHLNDQELDERYREIFNGETHEQN